MLTGLAGNDLAAMFRAFDSADATRDGLLELLPRLVAIYGAAAATLGADWYDDLRGDSGARGRFRAIPAELPDQGRTDALARWAVEPMYDAEPDSAATLTKVTGGLQRIIANADRQTVAASSVADPAAQGWQRTGSGECGFCAMLIGRGAVYSEASADFASHDHCKCVAAPQFSGQERLVKPYTPTGRNITDADRARVREYLRNN